MMVSHSLCPLWCVLAPATLVFSLDSFVLKPLATQQASAWLASPPTLLPGLLGLTYAKNTGVAFSLFHQEATLSLVVITAALLVILLSLLYWQPQLRHTAGQQVGWGLLLGGALCNWLDRLLTGGVTDYLQVLFMDFAIMNLSDWGISLGAALIALPLLRPARTTHSS